MLPRTVDNWQSSAGVGDKLWVEQFAKETSRKKLKRTGKETSHVERTKAEVSQRVHIPQHSPE